MLLSAIVGITVATQKETGKTRRLLPALLPIIASLVGPVGAEVGNVPPGIVPVRKDDLKSQCSFGSLYGDSVQGKETADIVARVCVNYAKEAQELLRVARLSGLEEEQYRMVEWWIADVRLESRIHGASGPNRMWRRHLDYAKILLSRFIAENSGDEA